MYSVSYHTDYSVQLRSLASCPLLWQQSHTDAQFVMLENTLLLLFFSPSLIQVDRNFSDPSGRFRSKIISKHVDIVVAQCWNPLSCRCGSVTLPQRAHHAEVPAQDAGATLHPETRREVPVEGGPARHDAHPRRRGRKVHHHLPCVLTGRDGRQRGPAGTFLNFVEKSL